MKKIIITDGIKIIITDGMTKVILTRFYLVHFVVEKPFAVCLEEAVRDNKENNK